MFQRRPTQRALRQRLALQQGFSLLEILISVIVLSFGLLGMVGMQAAALQANKESRLQSSAVRLAREFGEMMRGNKGIGVITTNSTNNPYLVDYPTNAAPSATNCFTADCTSVSTLGWAQFEVRDWITRVNSELPGARVRVCFDSTPFDSSGRPEWTCDGIGGVAVIKIGWAQGSTKRAATGTTAATAAIQQATVPSVVLPVTAGSTL